jgi:phytoene dehydrogenase-like protein
LLDLALERPVPFRGRGVGDVTLARCASGIDALERAFDPIKYGEVPETPALEIQVPTVERPELAPAGGAVVSVMIHFVPGDRGREWTDELRERLADRVVRSLETCMPGLGQSIVGRRLSIPSDLERRWGLSGGNMRHGEHSLDQLLVRPVPDCAGYRTPVGGLYLCGGGNHPGGWPSCAPGFHAANRILAERDR